MDPGSKREVLSGAVLKELYNNTASLIQIKMGKACCADEMYIHVVTII